MNVPPARFAHVVVGEVLRVNEIAREFPVAIARVLFLDIAANRSPVGPAGVDAHSGLFRGSLRAAAGTADFAQLPARPFYPVPGSADFERGVGAPFLGASIFLTDDASSDGGETSYAQILDEGRRTDSRGRGIGSAQAPQGVVPPALQDLDARASQIAQAVVAQIARGA